MTDGNGEKQNNDEELQKQNTKSDNIEHTSIPKHREGDWMLKPCDAYFYEYKDCKSMGARYYQKFYYGEALNCLQWKTDYDNCQKWQEKDDDIAYDELLTSEKNRRLKRLQPHVKNDVWKPRKAPPSDWNEPLPDWISERQESTYLNVKQKEYMEAGEYTTVDLYAPSCSIL